MMQWATPCVHLVTDRRRLAPDARTTDAELVALERFLDDALDAGVDAIQIRERDLEAGTARRVISGVVGRARGRAVILVNDRVDVALAAGAGGVHLRADSAPTEAVRHLGGPGWTIGRSVHSPEEAGGELNADYVLFGTVFSTDSKPGAAPAGLERLQDAAAASHAPVIAIGGITPERAALARTAGAAGVAAIGVFLPPGRHPSALGVRNAVRALRTAMQPR
jgi:thiamine-phosphate diphosphorylase